MRSKEKIEKMLTGVSGYNLLPQARSVLETELAIAKEKEEKKESQTRRRRDSVRFWVGFGVSTALSIVAIIIAVIAVVK